MKANQSASPWLVIYRTSSHPRVRLFCFPYAGGAAHIFRQWPQSLPAFIEVCAVQLPGRGGHTGKKPFTNLKEAVTAAASALAPYMDRRFAFFGHSMGAMIGFELARYIRNQGNRGASHLLVSGCPAPQLAHMRPITYDLPEPEFLEELRRLKGTPIELLEHLELLQLMLPLLRADFAVTQTYKYSEEPPLACPLTVFGGLKDEEVRRETLSQWREHTTGTFSMHILPGDHFFLERSQGLLLKAIACELEQIADTSS